MIILEVTSNGIDFWTLTSIIASIVSVIIGGFAIWLSVTFYKLSGKVAEDTKEASKSLGASVQRLETLFDRLYSDTFGIMKDTVSDMRKHIWTKNYSEEEMTVKVEEKATEKIINIKKELNNELSELIKRVGATEEKVDSFKDLSGIIEKAINQTRKVENEAQREVLQTEVLNDILGIILQDLPLRMGDILHNPRLRKKYPRSQIINCIKRYKEDDIIEVEGDVDNLNSLVRKKFNDDDFEEVK